MRKGPLPVYGGTGVQATGIKYGWGQRSALPQCNAVLADPAPPGGGGGEGKKKKQHTGEELSHVRSSRVLLSLLGGLTHVHAIPFTTPPPLHKLEDGTAVQGPR